MDSFKSQIIHVVKTVDKLDLPDRLEALSYLQRITEAFKNNSVPIDLKSSDSVPISSSKKNNKMKHKCKDHLCLIYNVKHLKKISCFKCEKRLENESQLFDHSQTHLDFPLSCIHCHCTFRNIEDFNSHRVNYCKPVGKELSQNSKKYSCTVCDSNFSNKKVFQSHLLDNHGVKLYNNWYGCKLCREMFEQKKMLFHHYKQVHSEMNYQLKIKQEENCKDGGNCIVNQNLIENGNYGNEADKFQCYHCQKYFEKKYLLRRHVIRHIPHKIYSCNLCKKSFNVYRYYQRHLQSVSHVIKNGAEDHPLFKCEKCDHKVFSQRDALTRHMLRFHQAAVKHLKCPLCDFTTGFETSLTRHVNLHTDNRKFICDQCGACFHTHSALKDHTAGIHSNERNYSCEMCGQRFKLKSGLNRHFKTHSEEKDYKCFCGQVYKFRTNLRRHLWNTHRVKSDQKSRIFRVTTEDEGYAMNNPKMVQRKTAKQKKIDDFDITSLSALSDVDLSCADDVLRATYDNFAKYSNVNVESQENFNSILGSSSNIIDHVLQGSSNELKNSRLISVDNNKTFTSVSSDLLANQHLPSMNFRVSTYRQCSSGSFMDPPCDHQYSQNNYRMEIASEIEGSQCLNSSETMAICSDKQFSANHDLQDIPVEDEPSFSYTRWLNEIL